MEKYAGRLQQEVVSRFERYLYKRAEFTSLKMTPVQKNDRQHPTAMTESVPPLRSQGQAARMFRINCIRF